MPAFSIPDAGMPRLVQTWLGTERRPDRGVANPEDQMSDRPDARLVGFVLDAPNPRDLAAFYRELLGWTAYDEDDTWVRLGPADDSRPGLSIQLEPNYRAPTWPGVTDAPQMQAHLDILVDDLDAASVFAESLGARQAEWQPQQGVRVMIDPVGHIFDLFVEGS